MNSPRLFVPMALTLFLITLFVPSSVFGARGQQSATLYRDAAFGGVRQDVYGDVADLGRTSIGNGRLSSIIVPFGCRARLYAGTDFRGPRVELNADVRDLGRTPLGNDRARSIKVRCGWQRHWGVEGPVDGSYGQDDHGYDDHRQDNNGQDDRGHDDHGYGGSGTAHRPPTKPTVRPPSRRGRVVLYRDVRHRGRDQRFPPGDYPDLRETAVGNDAVSSLEIQRGCRVRLYQDTEFRGDYEEIGYDVADLRGTRIGNDHASSMQVRCGGDWHWGEYHRRGGVILFADVDFRGYDERFEHNVPDLRATQLGSDTASSIAVDRGCRVRLYEDVGYRGRSIELTHDEAYLGQTRIGNDRVSSLQIDCRF